MTSVALSCAIATLTLSLVTCFIVNNGRQPDCWGIGCHNNGSLDNVTCTCSCHVGFTGLFCETELKDTLWPKGRYSILSTVFGCPEDYAHGWQIGYVNMTLNKERPGQRWKKPKDYAGFPKTTPDPHILGPYTRRSLQLNFCTRSDTPLEGESVAGNDTWPNGEYCLFQYGSSCPNGFLGSQVSFGEYTLSWSSTDGVIPHVTIGNTTEGPPTLGTPTKDTPTSGTPTFYFCCHEEHWNETSKSFPTTFPFILMKTNTSSCGQIDGMALNEERFDFVDDLKTFTIYGNTSVLTDTGDGYQRLELCYYAHNSRRECMHEIDGGFSYRGTHNTSKFGNPCIHWYNVTDKAEDNQNTNQRKAVYDENFIPNKEYIGDFDNNYCRTFWPWNEYAIQPWCVVYGGVENGTDAEQVLEPCDIPFCETDTSLETVDLNKPVYSSNSVTGKSAFAVDGLAGTSFFSKRPFTKPWIQVDLEESLEVHAILIQRRYVWFPNNLRFPGVYISNLQWDFITYGARQCTEKNFPRRASSFLYECYRPIVGQYVTIRNFDNPDPDTAWGAYYVLSIKEITVYYKRGVCSRRLGIMSGNIRDYQLDGSSDERKNMFDHGRLYNSGSGWCTSKKGKKYFEVDLIVPIVIHGLEIQGTSESRFANVQEVIVKFGNTPDQMQPYLDNNQRPKKFKMDDSGKPDMVHRFLFYRTFIARYIHVIVTSPVGVPVCMKMELIGCPKRIIRDMTCSQADSIDVGYEANRRTAYWLQSKGKKLPTKQQCLEECARVDCLSLFYSKPKCHMLNATRYNPHYKNSVINGLTTKKATYTRLCIRDIRDYDDCDALITEPSIIESPLYPEYYGQLSKCVWTVQFPPGKYPLLQILHLTLPGKEELVKVQGKGYFDINIGVCKDTLSFEGFAVDADNAHDYRSSMFISCSSNMTLTLKSCARYSKTVAVRFRINVTYSDIPGCGFFSNTGDVLCTDERGIIAVPGFPTQFPLDAVRYWTIQGQTGQYVELSVKVLFLPGSNITTACRVHSITIEDLSLQNEWTHIGTYCDLIQVLEPIQSSWNTMRLTFKSGLDRDFTNLKGAGFMAEYRLVQYVQNIETQTNQDCPTGWEYNNQSCYQLFSVQDGLTWIQAEDRCQRHHGHLVSFHSRPEVDFIHYLLTKKWTHWSDKIDFYIGLKKSNYGGHFADYQWSDGSPATFFAWHRTKLDGGNQPNGLNYELCTFLRLSSILSTDNWHDVTCAFGGIFNYICETRHHIVKRNHLLNAIDDNALDIRSNISMTEGLIPCGSGELIHSIYQCDGVIDCFDKSDERCGTGNDCPDDWFRCHNDECIATYMLCDFVQDCPDGSDELNCVYRQCTLDEWQCTSRQCIPRGFQCDVKRDCLDGSDEQNCVICQGGAFQCYDQRCVTNQRVCDTFYDCTGQGQFQEDETGHNCTFNTRSTCSDWYALGRRSNGTYLIHLDQSESFQVECRFGEINGSLIVETVIHHQMENPVSWDKDRVNTTLKYTATTNQIERIKETSQCRQYIKVGCQQVAFWIRWVASDGTFYENFNQTDDCDCPYVNTCKTAIGQCNCKIVSHVDWYSERYFETRYDEGVITNEPVLPIKEINTSLINGIEEIQFTIGPLICVEEAPDQSLSDLMVCRTGLITSMTNRCVLDVDTYGDILGCRDLSHLENCDDFICPPNFLKCPSSYCIPTRYICDGTKQCPNGEDEDDLICRNKKYCNGLYRCRGSTICIPRDYMCDGTPHCPQRDDESLCTEKCPRDCTCSGFTMTCSSEGFTSNNSSDNIFFQLKSLTVLGQMMQFSPVALAPFPSLNKLNVSGCGIKQLMPFHFNHTLNLIMLDISYNNISQLKNQTFYGLSRLKSLHLKGNRLKHVDALAFSNLISLNSLDLSGFSLKHFPGDVFVGLNSLRLLNISHNDIKQINNNQFEVLNTLTELDMRGNQVIHFDKNIYYGLDSLKALYTDSFTLCCVRPSSVTEENCWPSKNEFSSCDDLMKNEILRVAVWVIGIAALIGNMIVLFVRFFVERKNIGKTNSIFITNLGIADFLMGVYLIIIAITDRVFRGSYVWNDFTWRNGNWCKLAGILATVGSEGSVLFLCLITLDRFLVVKFPFGKLRITKNASLVFCAVVWVVVFALASVPLLIHGEFYSRSAVCLALPLTRDRPGGWQYSIGVFIIFNFLVFVLIATAQIVIYLEIASSRKRVASSGRRNDMAIAKKLFFVAITDFLCWFPVGLIGILALGDHVISGEVYAWIAVFVLPINSAINPFLYTLGGSLMQARSTMRDRLTSLGSITEMPSNVTAVFDSDLFMFGKNKSGSMLKMPLDQYLDKTPLNPQDAYMIALKLCRALDLLHSTELVHGSIGCSSVIVTTSKQGMIKNVVLKSSPKFCQEEGDFKKDISDIGEVIKHVLRNLKMTK